MLSNIAIGLLGVEQGVKTRRTDNIPFFFNCMKLYLISKKNRIWQVHFKMWQTIETDDITRSFYG